MAEICNEELVIKDIDLALYKYGLINKKLNNDINIEVKTNRLHKYKINLYKIWPFFDLIRYIIYFINCKNEKLPKYYFDCNSYIGGILQFYFAICILYSSLAFSVIIIFNKSNANHYQWLNIVYALKRQQSMASIGMNDINAIKEFIYKIKFIRDISIKSGLSLTQFVI